MSEPRPQLEPAEKLPPLRIHHFLIWMAILAVVIAIPKVVAGELWHRQTTASTVRSIVEFFNQSLAVTVVAIVVLWRWREKPLFTEPGQGILLQQCALFGWSLVEAVFFICVAERDASGAVVGFPRDSAIADWAFKWDWVIRTAIESLAFLASGTWIARAVRWRRFYFILFMALVLQATFMVVRRLPAGYGSFWSDGLVFFYRHTPDVLGMLLLFYVVTLDWRDQIPRHWTHWCGVVSLIVTSFFAIAHSLYQLFIASSLYSVSP